MNRFFILILLLASPLSFAATPEPGSVAHARAMLETAVAIPTVAGQARTGELAAYIASQLRQGGFSDADIDIQHYGDTATLTARYRGKTAAVPLLLSVHLDVVEARREDWQSDPFTVTEHDGFLFGRGVWDNKYELSMLVASLIELKRSGYVPARDMVLVASGDEESEMLSTQALARQFRSGWLVINADGDSNPLDDQGKPLAFKLQAAEKTYATFELRATNPGGHSSRPRADNAIYQLMHALQGLETYAFPVQLSELSGAYLKGLAEQGSGPLTAAMRALAADPDNAEAAALLSQNPEYAGILRTTCVATMLQAGHAENALAQSATATVNCRILPGTPTEAVRETLIRQIADPAVEVVLLQPYPDAPASKLREDVLAALRKAIDIRYPGLPILPQMAGGASDCLYFRAEGIDCYSITSFFMNPKNEFAHGLNERVPADAISPSLQFWNRLLRELTAH